jgi:AcrR family transcriptional regulator
MSETLSKNRQELRETIIVKARDVVAAEGLGALTARRIAAEADCAVGSIYNVFSGLDELILILNGETMDSLQRWLEEAVDTRLEGREFLLALGAAYVGFTSRHDKLWMLIFEHRAHERAGYPDWYHEKIARLLAMVERGLEPYLPAPHDRAVGARALWAAMHGVRSLSMTGKLRAVSQDQEMELIRALLEPYIRGLEAKRAGRGG